MGRYGPLIITLDEIMRVITLGSTLNIPSSRPAPSCGMPFDHAILATFLKEAKANRKGEGNTNISPVDIIRARIRYRQLHALFHLHYLLTRHSKHHELVSFTNVQRRQSLHAIFRLIHFTISQQPHTSTWYIQ